MAKAPQNAISPTRAEDYPEWYQQVIRAADMAENSPVRGCMVIKPWGYRLWENMQRALDDMFKATGHQNAYFPLLIPMSFLEKEAEHVEGFAKECAVVTHHRLEPDPNGGLRPAGKLDEPLIIRPTSETIIGATYAKWVQSYRDLPILINQWANVMRWELRTRMFLRTAEFLWQEGHTVHATEAEAIEETQRMIDVYADFAENWMAMPVTIGSKTPGERFPGAVDTMTIEAMMQDRKALQAGTSHFLGQNFSRAQEIVFQSESGDREYAWTTSWGVSTRLIGALIMTHADDDGLVLPPKLAPCHVIILPIYKDEQRAEVMEYIHSLRDELANQRFNDAPVRVEIDDRDLRGGEKKWHHVKRGVPIRLEIGPKDIEKRSAFMGRRDQPKSSPIGRDELVATIGTILGDIQNQLYNKAAQLRADHSVSIDNEADFRAFFATDDPESHEIHGGFAHCHFADEDSLQPLLKELKVTIRCIPREGNDEPGTCFATGKPAAKKAIFAKAY
ncbi:proline--tRNA ligase [Stieleria varia]|uniref:Proline--tRNA ligase n=1 Tax=Stieleria varia TaxID=2528005 RepID=A0A5C6AUD3_9BACT|nr:proline--tRNA ligase [Stieleria varia]TWU02622.1 Proline--tRNA ligase [Stieleria varia]